MVFTSMSPPLFLTACIHKFMVYYLNITLLRCLSLSDLFNRGTVSISVSIRSAKGFPARFDHELEFSQVHPREAGHNIQSRVCAELEANVLC